MTTFTGELPEFVAYKKIPRYRREITISEKIDGTNAVIHISEDGVMTAGSRTRWIAPGKSTDNYGFAQWVENNYLDLLKLGTGYRFGEWYGSGINRAYGLKNGEKRLALFIDPADYGQELPHCCEVTPRIYEGPRDEYWINRALELLETQGSYAVPGFMRPEGIVIFDHASRGLHKITLEHDEAPKGKARMANPKQDWKRRCAEAELVIEHAAAALEMIPIWALKKEQNWMPSAEAIILLERAKDSLNDFIAVHFKGRQA